MRPPARPRPPRRATGGVAPAVTGAEDRVVTAPAPEEDGAVTAPAPQEDRAARTSPAGTPPPGGGGVVEQLSPRGRARRRLGWFRAGVALAVLVTLALLGWLVLASSLLALDEDAVDVTGAGETTSVATQEVHERVAPHVGTPLARLDTHAVAADVGTITAVRGVQVHRSWPTGITVAVEPRIAVAAARGDDGVELLDVDGVVLGRSDDEPADLPVVTVPLDDAATARTLEAVLEVLAALPADLRADVATAGAARPGAIELELEDGATVRWGDAHESELKAAVLEVLRADPAELYDLTVPRAPTTG